MSWQELYSVVDVNKWWQTAKEPW